MRKIVAVLMILFVSNGWTADYSDAFKLYKKAKVELRKNNEGEAKKLFTEAHKIFSSIKNSSQAYMKEAELYCNGWGVNADKKKAIEYLKQAKQLGNSFVTDKCLKTLEGEIK